MTNEGSASDKLTSLLESNTPILGPSDLMDVQTKGPGPSGALPLTDEILRTWSSGDLFGLTQNAGMGWAPEDLLGPQYLVLSTQGGMRAEDGSPIALGYHTGHWEVGLLVQAASRAIKEFGGIPFAAYCSDPCDGRSQGTTGMFDSLPYRNDAAMVIRRLIRSLPTRLGLLGVATCDKGLPAMMQALAGQNELPGIIVPGGVTLPPESGEDAGKVQTISARYVHGEITLEDAAVAGCRACGTAGGGCQFLGTAATSQVVAEALGMTLPHAALAPSGQAIWVDNAVRSANALKRLVDQKLALKDIVTDASVRNAMIVHAACGGSTNLLLHIPAIAHAAGLQRPSVDDWSEVNRLVPRFVDVLPNGPANHPTVQFFLAGGVPEVMLHLRKMGLLDTSVLTVTGQTLQDVLDWWEQSDRRTKLRARLQEYDGINPDDVIISPSEAVQRGMTSTVCFPQGNLCPEGSVIKATSIDPTVVDDDGVYRKTGPARVFTSERDAIMSIKGQLEPKLQPGDILVLIGRGPLGTGMEETYQLTSALKFLKWGKEVAILTDARFSGVSTGACIGHVGPEALANGPIGRVQDGDRIEIIVDRNKLTGSVNLVGTAEKELTPEQAQAMLDSRDTWPGLQEDAALHSDTRLWAALQKVGGGTWGGCVYDVDRIVETLEAGAKALSEKA
ncbi:MAG: YjhG/YagF family D-xylonate dehydratase [Rhodopirellula sp.]|nr:YjhG/YagF family D-xylonate dehydratase [Rhodopirellula sp.]|tara:strand:- start:7050 stop:9071 length:2022 start_codon:yes stop_codon:yes gene_type:complete